MTNLPVSDATLASKHDLDQSRWWEQAACAGAPFDLFDAPTTSGVLSAYDRDRYARAATICAGCPVAASCRADADLLPDPSFRAGLSARDRSKENRAASA